MKKEPNFSRRLLIYVTMAFCMSMIVWLAWNGEADSELHQLIASGCFYTMGAVVLFYVLGANIDLFAQVLSLKFGAAPQAPTVPLRTRHTQPSSMSPP